MLLPRQAFSEYDTRLSDIEAAAKSYVEDMLSSLIGNDPDMTIEQMRDAAIDIVESSLSVFADSAGTVASDLYDDAARLCGEDLPDAELAGVSSTVGKWVAKEAHYQAGRILDGGTSGFVSAMARCAMDQTARVANETMRRNAARDGIRYARVPMGFEACPFCFMLASRGFVYRSAASAGDLGNHFHPNCRCKVIPCFSGIEVEGYDPEGMARRWDECARACGSRDRKDIMREVETRDWKWLYTGEEPAVKYIKPRSKLMPHEAMGVDALKSHGFFVTTLYEDPAAKMNIDLAINHVPWEMKNVSNSESSVSNQIGRCRKKLYKAGLHEPVKAVFTCFGCSDGLDKVCGGISKRMHAGDEIIVVHGEDAVRLKK